MHSPNVLIFIVYKSISICKHFEKFTLHKSFRTEMSEYCARFLLIWIENTDSKLYLREKILLTRAESYLVNRWGKARSKLITCSTIALARNLCCGKFKERIKWNGTDVVARPQENLYCFLEYYSGVWLVAVPSLSVIC